ncbi:hypothetical protein AAHA92_02702 [Salvia divinorum]|uniref:Myb/SANT-like domain-containing protein n=1 Tax=Salvia divinorum TaxID=28513 RepID=A0ABD1IFT6_SALDI
MSDNGISMSVRESNPSPNIELPGRARARVRAEVRAERSRRSWTDKEEDVLLIALKDLVTHGWKFDIGFIAGYLMRIDEALKREFSKTDIKVQPHIQSKINTWKRCYYSLALILEHSGVGFNSYGDFKIECNDEQWAQIVKADSNARFMRNKAWPLWDDWKGIFGKDRAGGIRAEDMLNADEKLHARLTPIPETQSSDYNFSLDDFYTQEQIAESLNLGHEKVKENENGAESTDRSLKSSSSMKKSSFKRKTMDAILEVMTKMHTDTNNRLDKLSTRIGYDFDLSAKRTKVSPLLDGIHGLSKKQNFLACDILVKEPERLDLFTGMVEVDKYDYLVHILEEKHGV